MSGRAVLRRGPAATRLLGIAGSNPAGCLDGCLLWVLCVIYTSGWSLVQRSSADCDVCNWVWWWSTDNEDDLAHWGLLGYRKKWITRVRVCVRMWLHIKCEVFCRLTVRKMTTIIIIDGYVFQIRTYYLVQIVCKSCTINQQMNIHKSVKSRS